MNGHWVKKKQILALLDHSDYVSGEQIAQKVGLSRTAVNNHISQLLDYGVDIYSVKGKGYKLSNPLPLFDEAKLLAAIDNRCFYFDDINSTNAFMLQHADELKTGDICIAEYQSAGRGRRGRNWVSPYGHHVYASIFWRLNQGMNAAMGLSLIVGCSIVKTLEKYGVENLGLKWPNDIYKDNKKLAGILIELSGHSLDECNLVIGFGINMSMSNKHAEAIDQPWSDLSALAEMPNKTDLMIDLHQQLKSDLRLFELQGLTPFIPQWEKHDLFIHKEVDLIMAPHSLSGICRGIDQQGAILLEINGNITSHIGGEISLRASAK
ncbi:MULTISPECIES: bifunctional biotin--[acetyl-CoA-carboxylase] ligase/biotin operon repressor BirA [unclassified Shewanella]|uniref:bifunctional biotin--[acetyl-CoA-carboxylase] ligase/biotin operon repressor BirA n=1 Tax=unclassified Shewanella TaxID=196818 RepID=UPI000C84574A|nr:MULTISPECIES: bifunctional biotin--[acetyl-CoA-carboxylase] ligase/biotin operon repressor BirA [unclassified Shewanella]MDO6642124.1 bifunctional biotin--[acetyl-CoA-carboxylase] ligase/biotin operon repressor BirA [Shewanella sp. 5_MG-2023]MDO6680629.1 bifunctional biotin--[acetyl-CoA-carboxylase] ligase/biotin operon repressor BirA [Shewanella sp. 4_MG-2023]PMG50171.1 biotin--[acetyl-CoA-carboxylase] ligase [Shewanella sp. 10N.286.52.B9]PMH88697.1 biotin--[acetyl-CoA-carboxylase] ligase [